MFVMPPTDPWRSFHIQAIHSKEKIQHFSASHVFSLAVSIFSASSPTMLREVVPRNVVLHTDGRLFAHYIFDVLNVCLAKRRVPSDLLPKLQCIAELLILWFFPDSHISHRTCAHLEVLMAVVFASRAILWLRTHHWTEQAKRVLRVLPPEECTVLKFGIGSNVETNTSCLQRIVDRQRHLIDGPPLVFGLYQWWSVSWRYVGIGKHQRKMHPSQGGLSRRFLEHMCGTIRSRYREVSLGHLFSWFVLPALKRGFVPVSTLNARCTSPAATAPHQTQRVEETNIGPDPPNNFVGLARTRVAL